MSWSSTPKGLFVLCPTARAIANAFITIPITGNQKIRWTCCSVELTAIYTQKRKRETELLTNGKKMTEICIYIIIIIIVVNIKNSSKVISLTLLKLVIIFHYYIRNGGGELRSTVDGGPDVVRISRCRCGRKRERIRIQFFPGDIQRGGIYGEKDQCGAK